MRAYALGIGLGAAAVVAIGGVPMILILLIAIPIVGGLRGLVARPLERRLAAPRWRWPGMAVQFVLACTLLGRGDGGGQWLTEFRAPWMPQLGISFHLAVDGMSLLMVLLTAFLGVVSVACSWRRSRSGSASSTST